MSGRRGSPTSGRLQAISANLFWFRDTCNVFLLRDGEAGLLIDAGSGAVLDHLAEVGVKQVEWVLHTHHHRDQCQGDPRLVEHGAQIAVPAREAALFAENEAFWRLRRQFDDYDASSLWNTLARPVPVARRLVDHETFEWRGHSIRVQPTPGHTRGSVTFLVEVDGVACAFSGDLIAAPGSVDTIHDLQWQYGMPDAVGAALHSVTLLAGKPIARLLPSHGSPMDDAPAALRALAANLRELYGLLGEIRRNRLWFTWPHSVDQPKTQVLPHLWANTHSVANTWALVADDGRTLLLDYGYPSWDHFFADYRFVEHSLDELRAVAGIRSIDAVIPSHYHDDHLAGVPWLQQNLGTQAWIHESFAEMRGRACGVEAALPAGRAHPGGPRARQRGAGSLRRLELRGLPHARAHLVRPRAGRRGRWRARRADRRQPAGRDRLAAARVGAHLPQPDAPRLHRRGCSTSHRLRAGAAAHRPHRGHPGHPRDARRVPGLGAPAGGGAGPPVRRA